MFLTLTIAAHLALLLLFARVPWLSVAVLVAYAAYHVFLAWAVLHPRSRIFGENVSRLATDERVCALTFDDGPHPSVTPRVLDILRERRIVATFFVIGRFVERYPETARRIVAEGHEIANHTHTHPYDFWALPAAALASEVTRASRAIEDATGRRCRFFRPPVGMRSCLLARVLRRRSLTLVSWDVRFLDRAGVDRVRIRARVARRVRPGSIVLLHDGHDRQEGGNPALLEKLPIVLEELAELGYRCVPLPPSSRATPPAGRTECSDR